MVVEEGEEEGLAGYSLWNYYDYKELTECISEVDRIEARVNSSKKKEWSTMKRKEEQEEETQQEKEELPTITTTLDNYFVSNNKKIAES